MPGSVVDRARHVHPRPGLVVLVDGLPRLHSASVGTGRRTTDTEFVGLDWSGLSGHGETTSRKESIILNEDLAEWARTDPGPSGVSLLAVTSCEAPLLLFCRCFCSA